MGNLSNYLSNINEWKVFFMLREFNRKKLSLMGMSLLLIVFMTSIGLGYAETVNGKSALLNDAISQVKKHRLTSGRTIAEEMNLSFPNLKKNKRYWKSHFLYSTQDIAVEYTIKSSNIFHFSNLVFKWRVHYDEKGAFDYIAGDNDITTFIEQSDECERREKVLSGFSKEEQEIFLYLFEKLDRELMGDAWVKYQNEVYKIASKKFGMTRQMLEKIFDKIEKKMFGDEDQKMNH